VAGGKGWRGAFDPGVPYGVVVLVRDAIEGLRVQVHENQTPDDYIAEDHYPQLVAVLRLNGITVEVEE
jgi:hypothetical protein